jgi:hypothetical protein
LAVVVDVRVELQLGGQRRGQLESCPELGLDRALQPTLQHRIGDAWERDRKSRGLRFL